MKEGEGGRISHEVVGENIMAFLAEVAETENQKKSKEKLNYRNHPSTFIEIFSLCVIYC